MLLIDVLMQSDGTDRKCDRIYYTTSRQLADDVQMLCLHAGVVSQVWGPYAYNENPPMYQVQVSHTKETPVVTAYMPATGSNHFTVSPVKDGRIVCFTVPNEVLVTRRKGRIAIQGNTKHAMHLVRLMRMGVEILEGKGVQVHRHNIDADELLAIRNGAWSYDQLLGWAEAINANLNALYATSTLQAKPDRRAVNAVLMELMAEAMAQ